jgi:aryl-alcohol dehydrogenase-like predicted oxidoreductase
MGYGAMQLAGPGVWGPPGDVDTASAVLREAVESGVNHIDISDYYGPHVTNQSIKQALHPYPHGLVIVTKLGARRGADKSWIPVLSRQELIDGDTSQPTLLSPARISSFWNSARFGAFACNVPVWIKPHARNWK